MGQVRLGRDPGSGRRPAGLHALAAALLFQGVSGIGGGIGLIADPSGEAMGIPATWLRGSPFADYLVPGLVLVTLLGIAPLVVAAGLWRRREWSWVASVLVGGALLVWLAVEIAVIGYQPQPPLQLVYGVLGAVILGLTMLPSVRGHLRRG